MIFFIIEFSFALIRPVNLLKNSGAEGDSNLWKATYWPDTTFPVEIKKQNEDAWEGKYSFSIDTRKDITQYLAQWEAGALIQKLTFPKKLSDVGDTFCWVVKTYYKKENIQNSAYFAIAIYMVQDSSFDLPLDSVAW